MSSRKGIKMNNVDFMTSKTLRDFYEFALSEMPEYMQFYGTISTHALNVQKISSCYRLSVKCNTKNAPNNFNQFKKALTDIVNQIHMDALCTLDTQIREDIMEMQDYEIQYFHTGIIPSKTNADFSIAFRHLYESLRERLILIKLIDVKKSQDGFYIDFLAEFNDGGYSPANYLLKVRFMM